MRHTPPATLTALTALCAAAGASGHHGTPFFDGNTEVRFDGVVVEFDYRNPHSWLYLRTTDAEGNPLDLAIEGQGSSLRPHGVTPDSLVPGDRVTAVVNPSWTKADEALGRLVIKEDGTVVPLAWQALETVQASTGTADSIAGIWLASPAGFTEYLRGYQSWPLTGKAREAADAYDPTQISQARCIPVPPPLLMHYRSANVVEILEGRVLIHSDWLDAERVIHTDGRSPADDEAPALHGFSTGHWENGTLVVETSHFSENNTGNHFRVPSGPAKHLVERFALADDGSHISYSYVLDDPDYLTAPISGTLRWDYRPDITPDDVPCDLESAGRYLTE